METPNIILVIFTSLLSMFLNGLIMMLLITFLLDFRYNEISITVATISGIIIFAVGKIGGFF